ncbi:zinc-binding dehydrogenase [Paraglaciecola sp.]|uniref:zinc-binding dehydrogenase n=1 Tax=Paraglaciecola sp. TaxID=1920173 RepID=UPI003EF910B8
MKAIVINEAGGPSNLTLQNIAEPTATEGSVKIRVKAFGLNRVESYFRSGLYGTLSEPRIPGIEAVGEIVIDSSGTFAEGQKVFTAMGGLMMARDGSYAEYVTAPLSHVQAVDADISWQDLATLPEAYLTVWGSLSKTLQLKAGETLLVRGGTSSIGLAAITYAKFLGAQVFATTRQKANKQRLFDIGADKVFVDDGQITQQVRAEKPEGVDKVIEVVGASTLIDSLKTVRHWGEVNVVGLLGGAPVLESFGLMSDLPNTVKLSFFSTGLLGSEHMPFSESPINELAHKLVKGELPSLLSKSFDFEDIQAAHEFMESNKGLGKLVVTL